jgi:hypothetical protein
MGAFVLSNFIVAWRFGGAGFMFVYLHRVSFYKTLLHCFSVCFIIFFLYCCVGLLLITVNLLSCMKLFALCLHSGYVSILFFFCLFFMVSSFVDISFFMSVTSFHSFLFFLSFYVIFILLDDFYDIFRYCLSTMLLLFYIQITCYGFASWPSVSIQFFCL